VVHGAGRVSDLAALGLEEAGVEMERAGLRVEGHLQSTSNPAVWAAGDSADTAGVPITPVAISEAKVAASNMIKGTTVTPDYTGIPTAVFTIPELVRVGMLESEAIEQGIDLDVRYSDTSKWFSNFRIGGDHGRGQKSLSTRNMTALSGLICWDPNTPNWSTPWAWQSSWGSLRANSSPPQPRTRLWGLISAPCSRTFPQVINSGAQPPARGF